jgi:5-methylcytosine-specific restriction endonuclease McrA
MEASRRFSSLSPLREPVLVLNANFEPLNVCSLRRAIALVLSGKAEILENSRGEVRTPSRVFPRPSVIRLRYVVRRPPRRLRLTKREILRRDQYTCQYCGRSSPHLTVDHVIPRHRGGGHTWENLVAACPACNRRKGNRTPAEAHMTLLRPPFEPVPTIRYLFGAYLREYAEWRKYLEGW